MRLLKIKDNQNTIVNYVVVEKISRFFTEKHKENNYSVHIDVNGFLHPLGIGVKEPEKIIQKLLNAIEITEDNIITFSVIYDNPELLEKE